ncbi:NAD(P)-binding protein [Podospora conica]|nr:NAD(P)-binding protein [Schizothecium conicum]
MKIEGRTFVVSGGSSGLGLATVLSILQHGGHAAILDLNPPSSTALPASSPNTTKFFECDVTSTTSITTAVAALTSWTATTGFPLGGIVPAAGIGLPGLILDKSGTTPLPLSSLDLVLNVNLRGTLDLVRQVLPHLAASPPHGPDGERGVVVMVASAAAFEGQMGQVAYAASKGAVAAMTLPMARDLSRHGIRVVTIAPSMFDSAMTAAMSDKVRAGLQKAMEFPARAGRPDEFASLVVQSIENAMLNGVVIRLDGATRMPSKL